MLPPVLKRQLAALAAAKAQKVLKEFNEMVPVLRGLGLGLTDISLKMAFPPEIGASLTGEVEALDANVIKALRDEHKAKKTIALILEALLAASNFKAQLMNLGFRGVKIDVKLGPFPSVRVGLLPKLGAELQLPASSPALVHAG